MTTTIHVYTTRFQPLTRSRDPNSGYLMTKKMNARVRCHRCRVVRCAKNLEIAVYYDAIDIRCRGGCQRRKVGRR